MIALEIPKPNRKFKATSCDTCNPGISANNIVGGKKVFVGDYSVQREKKKERKETII